MAGWSGNTIERGRIAEMSRAVDNTIAAIVVHEKALQKASAALDPSRGSPSSGNGKVASATATEHRAVLKKFAEECFALQCDCVASDAAEKSHLEQVKEKVRALNAWAAQYLNPPCVPAVAAVVAVTLESKNPMRYSWQRQQKNKLEKSRERLKKRTGAKPQGPAQYDRSVSRLALLLSLEKPKFVEPLLSLDKPKMLLEVPYPVPEPLGARLEPEREPLLKPPSLATATPPGLAATAPPGLVTTAPPGLAAAPPGLAAAMPPGMTHAMPPGLSADNATAEEKLPSIPKNKFEGRRKSHRGSYTSKKSGVMASIMRRGSVRQRRSSEAHHKMEAKVSASFNRNQHARIDHALMTEGYFCRSLRGWYLGGAYRKSFVEEQAFHAAEKKRKSYIGGVADEFEAPDADAAGESECSCAIQ